MPAFSGGHVTHLRPGGFPRMSAPDGQGSFAGKTEAEAPPPTVGRINIGAHGLLADKGNKIGKSL